MYVILRKMEVVTFYISFITFTILTVNVQAQKSEQQQVASYNSCDTDKDCNDNSFCYGNDHGVKGKCKCLEGYELLNRNKTFYECLPARQLGDPCERDIQCQIIAKTSAICNEMTKLCECNTTAWAVGGKCYEKIELDDICQYDENCYLSDGSHAFCTTGRCTCNNNYKPSPSKTLCVLSKNLGEACVRNEECTVTTDNTRCEDKCVCAMPQYTLARNESACIKAATKFGDNCEFDGQCSALLSKSICNDGVCGCSEKQHPRGLGCFETRKIGESCVRKEECEYEENLFDQVECVGGKCRKIGETGSAENHILALYLLMGCLIINL